MISAHTAGTPDAVTFQIEIVASSAFAMSLMGQKLASTAIMRLSALLPIAGIGPRLRTVFQDGRTAAFEKKPAKEAGQV